MGTRERLIRSVRVKEIRIKEVPDRKPSGFEPQVGQAIAWFNDASLKGIVTSTTSERSEVRWSNGNKMTVNNSWIVPRKGFSK